MREKLQYKPTQATCIMMHDAVRHITSARIISRDLAADAELPHFVQRIWTGVSADLSMAMQRIEQGIGKQNQASFKTNFSHADSLAYHNIQDLIRRMSPEQICYVEDICVFLIQESVNKITGQLNNKNDHK